MSWPAWSRWARRSTPRPGQGSRRWSSPRSKTTWPRSRRCSAPARGDHEDVMRARVAAGGDPSVRAQDGTTVLMAAAAGGRLQTFSYAYEVDPHVNVVTATGNTVMHVAVGLNGRTQPEVCEVIQ